MYREYPSPIPVEFMDPILGLGRGEAIGVREYIISEHIGGKRSRFDFIVRLPDGDAVLIWQRYILPRQ